MTALTRFAVQYSPFYDESRVHADSVVEQIHAAICQKFGSYDETDFYCELSDVTRPADGGPLFIIDAQSDHYPVARALESSANEIDRYIGYDGLCEELIAKAVALRAIADKAIADAEKWLYGVYEANSSWIDVPYDEDEGGLYSAVMELTDGDSSAAWDSVHAFSADRARYLQEADDVQFNHIVFGTPHLSESE
jgi:hypothetical protein